MFLKIIKFVNFYTQRSILFMLIVDIYVNMLYTILVTNSV